MNRVIVVAFIVACCIFNAMAHDKNISGAWRGTLKITPQVELRIVFNFKVGDDGKPSVTLDSPDQGAYGIAGEVNFISSDSVNVAVRRIGLTFAGRKHDGKLIGKCSQGAMSTDLDLSPGTVELKRPQTPKPPYPYTTKEVQISNPTDNVTLAGTLTLPDGYTNETPAVIMVTGSGLQNRDEEIFGHKPFAVIADYLARNGIVSLRYDDRGYGDSSGDGKNATTEDFAKDAKAALEYMRAEEMFNNIGVLGHSEGATIAFMLGSKDDSELFVKPSFIIAIGAQAVRGDMVLIDQSATILRQENMPTDLVTDYVEALHKMYELKIMKGNSIASDCIEAICSDWGNTPVHASLKANLEKIASDSTPWLNFYIGFSPAESIANTDCPIFVLYGEKDIQVRPELNMPQMQRLAPKATVKLYPGLNHLFQHAQSGAVQEYGMIEETIAPEVLKDIADYIMKTTTNCSMP
ncbi:MAG: alpha/beta hydrolase [Muribaculaceae bacterium]|nr:alpha/beta hydrolase [Muribaculaceae bacterium]